MTWLCIPILVLVAVHLITVGRRVGYWTADSVFVYAQTVMAIGSLVILEPRLQVDRVHANIIVYSVCAYIVTSVLVMAVHLSGQSWKLPTERRVEVAHHRWGTYALLALSLLIVVGYFVAVGYNLLLLSLNGLLTGSTVDTATLRLNSYSGARYFFPGYVNQFKNVLLPALTVLLVTNWILVKKGNRVISTLLVLAAVVGLLGTGQRAAFILFFVTVMVYLYWFDRKGFVRRARKLAGPFLVLLVVATLALGRSAKGLASAPGWLDKAVVIFEELQRRVIYSNQLSGVAGFRYVYGRPTQNGAEWLQSIVGLLPGETGSTLSNEVFESLYGGSRGTSPVSIWGSIYYNFGVSGIVIAPLLLAIVFQLLSLNLLRHSVINTWQLMGMAGMFVTLGTWIAGGPVTPINAGFGVYVCMWLWGQRDASRTSPESSARAGSHPPRRQTVVGVPHSAHRR